MRNMNICHFGPFGTILDYLGLLKTIWKRVGRDWEENRAISGNYRGQSTERVRRVWGESWEGRAHPVLYEIFLPQPLPP